MTRHTTNEPVVKYAGIDFHKRTIYVTFGDENGQVVEQVRVGNDPKEIEKTFGRYPGLVCAIESTRASEWFVELLVQLSVKVVACHPFGVRLISDSACKTDKIDSRILMQLLAKGFLPLAYMPTKEETLLREKLRLRQHMVKSRTMYKNRAHDLLDKENASHKLASLVQRQEAAEQTVLSWQRKQMLDKHLQVIDFFDGLIGKEDSNLIKETKHRKDIGLLKTMPGVGDISALMIVCELGSIERFKNAKSVSKYIGLTPRIYSSANTTRIGPITKKGPPALRRILIQDAWTAIRTCKPLRRRYLKISKRRGKQIAVVAIARMLAEIAYRILRDKKPFDVSLLALG